MTKQFPRRKADPSRRDSLFYRLTHSALLSAVLLTAVCLAVGFLALYFGAGDFRRDMFDSYFNIPLLPLLNLLPLVWLGFLLWFLIGRAGWAAFFTAVIGMTAAMVNVIKLNLRNTPLMAVDLFLAGEAGNMAGNYSLALGRGKLLGIAIAAALALFALIFARCRIPLKPRIICLLLWLAVGGGLWFGLYLNDEIYAQTENADLINPWSEVETYESRGFVYSFLRSVPDAVDTPPKGYKASAVSRMLEDYKPLDIPANRQVNIIAVQLEAFADFSDFAPLAAADSCYAFFHQLQSESLSGQLYTDTFAGGTVYAERSFLTGISAQGQYRAPQNSYVRDLAAQGYVTRFDHPNNGWFYDRANVSEYLGFSESHFYDDTYETLLGGRDTITRDSDRVLMPALLDAFRSRNADAPYFNLAVTYQNHGPYSNRDKGAPALFTPGSTGWSEASCNILNNYFAGIAVTDEMLEMLVDGLRNEDAPVVLVLYGDHKPWLGDSNAVYQEIGYDLTPNCAENLYNLYTTPYLIWANDAAQDCTGGSFRTGDGPMISPCYLMNLLFEQCGWTGSAYMQYADTVRERIPVSSISGFYLENGEPVTELSPEGEALFRQFEQVQYYNRRVFKKAA